MGIARLFTQPAVVETYLGAGTTGAKYGPPTTRMCFINDMRKLVRNATGAEVVSETTLYDTVDSIDIYAPQSRVLLDGHLKFVISAYLRDSAGPVSAHHVQITLT